ncbi:MAG: hypothetical protein O2868_19840 [Proteobacteria bacterium]|nr:hypothetical protein [Pseudomonadota bacterium]
MIQIHTSKALAADLKAQLAEVPAGPGAMQWYAHRVYVLRCKCVVAMEAQSRYAMIFTGLTKPDFEMFPELFLERLASHEFNFGLRVNQMLSKRKGDNDYFYTA